MQTIEQTIRSFVQETFLIGQDSEALSNEMSFLERGIIDSTGVLELVSFIEESYGIRICDEELIPDNLDSVSRVTRFIESKLGNAAMEHVA